jgi:hypothetical protein
MSNQPPKYPDVKRQLQAQLYAMSPRAFELFAGDLLVYVGLEKVSVTRYVGDGGIDAEGDLIAGIFRLPVGVQVKRYRKNVQRSDIDKFIGALSGRFSQGIFVTTASFSTGAQQKAADTLPRVFTMNGAQIIKTMVEHHLGLASLPENPQDWTLDEAYFADFEDQKAFLAQKLAETSEEYDASSSDEQPVEVKPEEDLVSLRALSYALRVDTKTIRLWLDSGKLQADGYYKSGERDGYYFRRDRIETIRQQFIHDTMPASSHEWRQEFLDFTRSRKLTKSYKPVLLQALLRLVDRDGKVKMDDLVQAFRAFYVQRQQAGLPVEFGGPLSANPAALSDGKIKSLIVKHPLERFLIQKHLSYDPDTNIIQIAPQIWQDLRYYEVLDALQGTTAQIDYYYSRHDESDEEL